MASSAAEVFIDKEQYLGANGHRVMLTFKLLAEHLNGSYIVSENFNTNCVDNATQWALKAEFSQDVDENCASISMQLGRIDVSLKSVSVSIYCRIENAAGVKLEVLRNNPPIAEFRSRQIERREDRFPILADKRLWIELKCFITNCHLPESVSGVILDFD